MNANELKLVIYERGFKINEFICVLAKEGVLISRTAFYRKMKGITEFNRREIAAIQKALDLEDNMVMKIFFNKKVS